MKCEMGCGWWDPPTPYKEDCYWYREEQDMNAHIPYCACKNQFPLNTCENCDDYHSRNRRTKGDKIRSMSDEELAEWLADEVANHGGGCCAPGCYDCSIHPDGCKQPWLDWLRQSAEEGE